MSRRRYYNDNRHHHHEHQHQHQHHHRHHRHHHHYDAPDYPNSHPDNQPDQQQQHHHHHRHRHILPRMTEPMLGRPEDCEDWYVAVVGYLEPLGLARPEETMSRRETLLAAHIVQAALADGLREQLDRSGVRWDSVTDICRRLDSMRPRGGGGGARMREFVRITVYD